MVAVIGVKGQAVVHEGPSRIGAKLQFNFLPSEVTAPSRAGTDGETTKDQAQAPGTPASPGGRVQAALDAKGYISKISLAQEITLPQPGNDGRLKQTILLERVLERRVGQAGEFAAPLEVPNPEPVANVKNSWLIYDDPQGRFHLLHPQELRVANSYPDGGIDLLDRRPDGQDAIQVSLNAKTEDPQRDRLAADPIQEKKQLEDEWKRRGEKVVPGPSGWLPEADWSKYKRKVFRIEAALIPGNDATQSNERIYLDRYVVQFTRNEVLRVTAMTTRDPHVQFRDSAESIIRHFEFGPSESSLPSAPTRVPTTPPPRVPTTPRPR
jgi:hypothetical protein